MRILLDAHISPRLAEQLQHAGIDAVALRSWRNGDFLNAADASILAAAASAGRVLVTFDLRTIPELLKEWAETDRHHGGVILVDGRTLRPNDLGGLLRALRVLITSQGDDDWQNRVVFLRAC